MRVRLQQDTDTAGAAGGRALALAARGVRDSRDGEERQPARRGGGATATSPPGRRRRRGVGRRQSLSAYLLLSPALALYIAFIGIPLVGIVADLLRPVGPDLPAAFRRAGQLPGDRARHQLGQTLSNTFFFDHHDHGHPCRARHGPGHRGDHGAVAGRALLGADRDRDAVPDVGGRGRADVVLHHGRHHRAAELLPDQAGPAPAELAGLGHLVAAVAWSSSTSGPRSGFTFIIFLVGLQSIPAELYEAAVDRRGRGLVTGSAGSRCRCCPRPRSSPRPPAFIGAFEIFTWPLIDTNGGPVSPPRRSCSTSTATRSRTTSSATPRWCR